MTKMFDRFLKNPEDVSCGCDDGCCGSKAAAPADDPAAAPPSPLTPADHRWITGTVETPAGMIPVVSTRLNRADRRGTILARLTINRMSYTVRPGLYAFGAPDPGSPVFVTGNYKMSFDFLRRALDGRSGWILVLDTRGINVWCAAGKGTFGTDELVHRIEATGLHQVVSHRTLILPQLGAPGVAAHEVARRTKFRVVYGPVRAEDLGAFLEAGSKASPEMRLLPLPVQGPHHPDAGRDRHGGYQQSLPGRPGAMGGGTGGSEGPLLQPARRPGRRFHRSRRRPRPPALDPGAPLLA